jgi:hypothetical protein
MDGTVSQQELDDAVQSNLANLASVAVGKRKMGPDNKITFQTVKLAIG